MIASQNQPAFHVKKREWTAFVGVTGCDTLCMLAVELVENYAEEQQEYQTGLADLEQPVVRVRYPAGNADTENVDAGNQPYDSGHKQQRIGRYSVFHIPSLRTTLFSGK